MAVKKIVVDSDIIIDHLLTKDDRSLLRQLMVKYFCYTTVFNAIEVFSYATTKREIKAADDAMSSMKVLGLSSKNAKNLAPVFKSDSSVAGLIAGAAKESGLPVVSMHPSRFRKIKGVAVLPVKKLIH